MQYLDRVNVPTLNVAGWWDQEDFYGPLEIYKTLEPHDTKRLQLSRRRPVESRRLARPHRATSSATSTSAVATAQYFRKNIETPWFAYWLKDKGTLQLAEATTFESGANEWRSYDSWPPKREVTERKLYFQADGKLAFEPPRPTKPDSAFDAYVSDPAKPVPYRVSADRADLRRGLDVVHVARGRSAVRSDRPDVAVWQTPPLEEDIVIAGDVLAKIFASTTGSDADWVVKLIDVYPEKYEPNPKLGGYQFMVANDVFRGRFRKSFEKPEPITPNKVEEFSVDLHQQSYRFKKGHRLMVQVQSCWFPLIDRNPQTFVPNIFKAKDSDFRAATQKVFRSPQQASFISLPVVQAKVVQ